MKSITIHKLDDELEAKIIQMADEESVSLNQLVKRLLRERLGLGRETKDHRADFEEFCGQWTAEEAEAFKLATAGCAEIDDELWP